MDGKISIIDEKYNPKYEAQIAELAENRLQTKTYEIFDYQARIYARKKLPELKESGRPDCDSCLIIINKEG